MASVREPRASEALKPLSPTRTTSAVRPRPRPTPQVRSSTFYCLIFPPPPQRKKKQFLLFTFPRPSGSFRPMAAADVLKPDFTAQRRHFIFTDEHEQLAESINRFVIKELLPHADEWEENTFADWVFPRMGELGFLGLN